MAKRACLTCCGALDADAIRREMQTPEQRAADPYVHGVREPQPAVLSINSTVSSLAMTLVLGAVMPVPVKPRHQTYDGIRGRIRETVLGVMDIEKPRSAVQLADAIDEMVWDANRAANRLVRRGAARLWKVGGQWMFTRLA